MHSVKVISPSPCVINSGRCVQETLSCLFILQHLGRTLWKMLLDPYRYLWAARLRPHQRPYLYPYRLQHILLETPKDPSLWHLAHPFSVRLALRSLFYRLEVTQARMI